MRRKAGECVGWVWNEPWVYKKVTKKTKKNNLLSCEAGKDGASIGENCRAVAQNLRQ